jgi:hypothetical protein
MKARSKPPLKFSTSETHSETPGLEQPVAPSNDTTLAETMAESTPKVAERELAPIPAAAEPELSLPPMARVVAEKGSPAPYWIAAGAAAIWAVGVASFAAYEAGLGQLTLDPLTIAAFVLLALAPAGLLVTAAQLLRQSARLAAETRRAHALSESLVAPAALASNRTAAIVKDIRTEVDEATRAVTRARAELTSLREALVLETKALNEAARDANRTAKSMADALRRERLDLTQLGTQLDGQAAAVVDAVERQARMVAEASDLAQTQLREAEGSLAARAADLAAAAGEAQDAARLASDDLARQTIRLETAGAGVSEQIRSVEEGLSQQRAALVAAAYALRADQEDFSAQVESQRAQLSEALGQTRVAAADLGEVSARGVETLRDLVQGAVEQFRTLTQAGEQERTDLEERTLRALQQFTLLAQQSRDELMEETNQALSALAASAEDARRMADVAAEAAAIRVDRLSEAAYQAGRRADEAFDTRLAQARRAIEESTAMVEDSGDRVAERLNAGLAAVRQALAAVDEGLAEIDGRAARLPAEAKARVDEIRAAVEAGLETLATAARRAAEETQAVDDAFQERVKRNYDMLTEAVRLMGVVSGGQSPAPRRTAREEPPAAAQPAPAPPPAPEPAKPAPDSTSGGLRPRLKLTQASDDEFQRVFDEARGGGAAPKRDQDGWTWKDLLGGGGSHGAGNAESEPPEAEDDSDLGERLIREVEALGVDPNALLPRVRVEEAAQALMDNDGDGARQVVRRVAPAAVRRLSRRILTDKALRAQAERYVRAFSERLRDAAGKDDGRRLLSALSSHEGRTFLLIDAAVGDLV